jgi:hypothetical protein
MPSAAFWRAWSIWAVSLVVTFTAIGYTALHPLPASVAANFGGTGAGVVGVVFVLTFASVGAFLAVPHGTPALPPVAAGSLAGRRRPGGVGPRQRVRAHDRQRELADAKPAR